MESATVPNPSEATELPVDVWRSPRVMANVVKGCLVCFALVSLAAIFSDFVEIQMFERHMAGEGVTFAEAETSADRQARIGWYFLLGFLLVVISFLVWLYQVSKNLQTLQVTQRFSPGKAIASWFFPIFSLFVPYMVMVEIWKGSHPLPEGRNALQGGNYVPDSHDYLPVWWAAWISGAFGTRIVGSVGSLFFTDASPSELIWKNWFSILGVGLTLFAGIMLFILVSDITDKQERKHSAILEQDSEL